jgi:dynein heavy chain
MLNTIIQLIPKNAETQSSEKSYEELLKDKCCHFKKKLPPLFDFDLVRIKYPITSSQGFNTVLQQEVSRFNNLITVINHSI